MAISTEGACIDPEPSGRRKRCSAIALVLLTGALVLLTGCAGSAVATGANTEQAPAQPAIPLQDSAPLVVQSSMSPAASWSRIKEEFLIKSRSITAKSLADALGVERHLLEIWNRAVGIDWTSTKASDFTLVRRQRFRCSGNRRSSMAPACNIGSIAVAVHLTVGAMGLPDCTEVTDMDDLLRANGWSRFQERRDPDLITPAYFHNIEPDAYSRNGSRLELYSAFDAHPKCVTALSIYQRAR